MIEINEDGKKVILRNIQEQVQKNKTDIEDLRAAGATLSSFGIKVVGNVASITDLPNPSTYIGSYGDAYLVGSDIPYTMSIFTRPYGESTEPQWVNIGNFPAQGPQGETGPQGPAGEDGTSINVTYGLNAPLITGTETESDIYIRTAEGNKAIYVFRDSHWNYVTDINGETGPQGPAGPQGATGTTLSIVNKLSSSSLLPTDFSSGNIPKNSAYLIPGSNNENHLWIILGEQGDYSTWHWSDAGDFNLGSVIYKGGQFQYSVDIDTSLTEGSSNLITNSAVYNAIYAVEENIGEIEGDVSELQANKQDKLTVINNSSETVTLASNKSYRYTTANVNGNIVSTSQTFITEIIFNGVTYNVTSDVGNIYYTGTDCDNGSFSPDTTKLYDVIIYNSGIDSVNLQAIVRGV